MATRILLNNKKNNNDDDSDSSLEFELDSDLFYNIRYQRRKSKLDYQNYFDNILDLFEHLIQTNYTFDVLRYMTVKQIVKDIQYLFSHKNKKRKIYFEDGNHLSLIDYIDYENLIRGILDDNFFELTKNDILMIHEYLNKK